MIRQLKCVSRYWLSTTPVESPRKPKQVVTPKQNVPSEISHEQRMTNLYMEF
jgi:hypothetical protein